MTGSCVIKMLRHREQPNGRIVMNYGERTEGAAKRIINTQPNTKSK